MCHPRSDYIIFSLTKLKFYRGQGPWAKGWKSDMRAGGQGPNNPSITSFCLKIIIRLRQIRETASMSMYIFLSTIRHNFLFHSRGQRRLFTQELPKVLILLCIHYDVALKLDHCETLRGYNKIHSSRSLDPSVTRLFYTE